MDLTQTLQHIGLDRKQTKCYLALLELGSCSMTELANKAKLKRPTAYLAIEELQMMGLVSITTHTKKKTYSATHPQRIADLVNSRAKQIEDKLPELTAIYNTPTQKPKIQVFEGQEGVALVYRDIYKTLSEKNEVLLTTRIDGLRKFMPFALTHYLDIISNIDKPRIRELNYGNKAALEWQKELKPYIDANPNHEVRNLPLDFEFGFSDTIFFADSCALFSLKENVFVTVIQSVDINKSLRAVFEWAWQMGR